MLMFGTLLGLCIGLVCIIGGTILENLRQSTLTTRLSGKLIKFTDYFGGFSNRTHHQSKSQFY